MKTRKAIALFSGGLDSRLAALLVARQSITVNVVHCITGFEHVKELEKKRRSGREFCLKYELEYQEISIEDEFLKIVADPRHGWGKNLNPCVDCKILMITQARSMLVEAGADFVVTGEVLAQRPMSQHGPTLQLIEKEANMEGLVLRPLSARLLPPTLPEERGWVDRERLEAISGRSRKPQMLLARQFGLEEYPPPAGGCLLTDPRFSDKLRDILAQGALTRFEVELLKVGRHFRLTDQAKLVMARDEMEANLLLDRAGLENWLFYPTSEKGPLALGRGVFSESEQTLAARLVSSYSRYPDGVPQVVTRAPGGEKQIRLVSPLPENDIEAMRL